MQMLSHSLRGLAAASAVFACTSVHAAVLDLSAAGSSGTINGATFRQAAPHPAGSGAIDAFVRLHGRGAVQRGHNTDRRPLAFDENRSPNFTRSLALNDVPRVNVGGVNYREFMLDVNESASRSRIVLDEVQIFLGAAGDLIGLSNLGSLVYDLDGGGGSDAQVVLNYNTSGGGSGTGDMLMLVPDASFAEQSSNAFVYLYSSFSDHDAGFEEWAVSRSGSFMLPGPVIPEPASLGLLSFGAILLAHRRRGSRG